MKTPSPDEWTAATRPWRALLRVVAVDEEGAWLCVPGWEIHVAVFVAWREMPPEARGHLKPDFRFHARVNVGAEAASDLVFSGWEFT